MNKYYTPNISEFKVGFEYELLIPDSENDWFKLTIPDINSNNNIKDQIDTFIFDYKFFLGNEGITKKVRVKYLNLEDLLDLGYKQNQLNDNDPKDILWVSKTLSDKTEIEITVSMDTNLVCIKKYIPIFNTILDATCKDWKFETLFKGFIKNKSELKTLLKQLDIYEE